MKNKNFYKLFFVIFISIFTTTNIYGEEFQFDITEIEILNNGNLYKGFKRGTIKTNDGIIINADKFVYDKSTNVVNAEGKVEIEDKLNKIFNYLSFFKNLNLLGRSAEFRYLHTHNLFIRANQIIKNI